MNFSKTYVCHLKTFVRKGRVRVGGKKASKTESVEEVREKLLQTR